MRIKGSNSKRRKIQKMKKRTKITLRTKIYLTIVGLLALTGVFYAANPSPFATPGHGPLSPNGVAAIPDLLLVTQYCAKISVRSTATGMSRWWRRSRAPVYLPWKNTWLSLQFSPRRPGSPRATFSSHKALTSLSSREVSSRRLRAVGCPFSDHSSLTFDHVGTFGNDMIVTCENGPVWKVNGAGIVTPSRSWPAAARLKDQL